MERGGGDYIWGGGRGGVGGKIEVTKNGVPDKIWSKRVQQSSVGETAFTFPRPSACVSGLLNGRGSLEGDGG